MVAVAAHQRAQVLFVPVVEDACRDRSLRAFLPLRQQSKASSITSMPSRSQSSSSSGAGGLWLVRMALQPIACRSWIWRSQRADVDRRAERAEVVVVAHAVDRHVLAVEEEALVGIERDRADAKRRLVLVRPPCRPARTVVTAT